MYGESLFWTSPCALAVAHPLSPPRQHPSSYCIPWLLYSYCRYQQKSCRRGLCQPPLYVISHPTIHHLARVTTVLFWFHSTEHCRFQSLVRFASQLAPFQLRLRSRCCLAPAKPTTTGYRCH